MDKGLVTGNTYYYKVRTFCTSGGKKIYSDYSDPASMQVLPGKPSIQVVAANYNTITVSWKKVEGVLRNSERCSGIMLKSDAVLC